MLPSVIGHRAPLVGDVQELMFDKMIPGLRSQSFALVGPGPILF